MTTKPGVIGHAAHVLWLAFLASYRQHLAFLGGMLAMAMLRVQLPMAMLRVHLLWLVLGGIAGCTLWTLAEGLLWARRSHRALEARFAIIQAALRDAAQQNQSPPN